MINKQHKIYIHIDIYKKWRPKATERRLVSTGRIATAVIVVLGFAWIPVMKNAPGTLYDYLQSVQSYIAPPITVIFLLGILDKRMNAKGALATLYVGLLIGLFRLTLDTISTFQGTKFDGLLGSIASIPFSHFCIVFIIIVSAQLQESSF